jgi:hypothetical protein
VLAFADDFILLSTAKDKAQSLLRKIESYLSSLGMRIAAEKCASFAIVPTKEALIPTPTGNLKPDLVVVNHGRVQVVDITVHHEDTGYLDEGYKSKVEKYAPLLKIMAG